MANETTITAEPGKHDYFIVREFDAPRELVFKALYGPRLVNPSFNLSRTLIACSDQTWNAE